VCSVCGAGVCSSGGGVGGGGAVAGGVVWYRCGGGRQRVAVVVW